MKSKLRILSTMLLTIAFLNGCDAPVNTSSVSSSESSISESQSQVVTTRRLAVSKFPKRTYEVGEELSLSGLEVKLYTTTNGETDAGKVIKDIITDPSEGTKLAEIGSIVINVTCSDPEVLGTTFTITVNDNATVDQVSKKLTVTALPNKTEYYQGEKFDSTGLLITVSTILNGEIISVDATTDYVLSTKDGEVLSQFHPAFKIDVTSTKSNIEGTSFTIYVEESEQTDPTLPSAIDVFSYLRNSRNYTFEVTDSFRQCTNKLYFDEKSYYFESSKSYYGGYGFAEANNKVFKFTYVDGVVSPDIQYRNGTTPVTSLYSGEAFKSFANMSLDNLPTEIVTGNSYRLDLQTNQDNVVNFINMMNYGDVVSFKDVQSVMISVTGEHSIRIKMKVDFSYSGVKTILGEIKDVESTTSNKVINIYLSNGGGCKILDVIPDKFKKLIEQVQKSKNYTFTVKHLGMENKVKNDFVDRYIENACYSEDHLDSDNSIGYAAFDDTIFSYTIINGQVVAGDYVYDMFGNNYGSIYESINSFSDLDIFALDTTVDGEKLIVNDDINKNVICLNTTRSSLRNNESLLDKIYFEYIDEVSLKVVVDFGEYGKAEGIITDINTTTIPEITAFLEAGHGPLYNAAREHLSDIVLNMRTNYNYTEDLGYTSSQEHIGKIYYLSNCVYIDYELNGYEDYGFIDYNGSIYNFTTTEVNNNKTLVLGDVAKENASLKNTNMFPANSLSIFEAIDSLEFSIVNGYFTTTDDLITGEVCDYMNMSDYKDTYEPYGAGFGLEYNEANPSESILSLIYFVTLSDGSYARIENNYSSFNTVSLSFVEEFLNK